MYERQITMGAYKRYKVIDSIQDPNYRQWVGSFVQKVLRKGKIDVDTVEIYDVDGGKRIFIRMEGREYTIRLWECQPTMYDSSNKVCGENIRYALYEDKWFAVPLSDGSIMYDRLPLAEGCADVKWDNDILREDLQKLGISLDDQE